MPPTSNSIPDLGTAMVAEQARLIRLCTALTGDAAVAEDLAAATLLEAWRIRHKLYDVSGLAPWLSAIARNVCRRWLRKHAPDKTMLTALYDTAHDCEIAPADWLQADADWEQHFERAELVTLLDKALGLLPPDTRSILIEGQVYGRSHAEIADHLQLSIEVVAMRLSRGRAQLKKLLMTEFAEQIVDYGWCDWAAIGWEPTHIWCPTCGRQRMEARYDRPAGDLSFRCPVCSQKNAANHADTSLANRHFRQLLAPVKRYKIAWKRIADWTHTYYRQGIADQVVDCTHCGQPNPLQRRVTEHDNQHRLIVECAACGDICSVSLTGMVLALPVVRQFWQDHPRLHTLPQVGITLDGRAAIATTFQSITHHAALEVISAIDDFRVLAVSPVPKR